MSNDERVEQEKQVLYDLNNQKKIVASLSERTTRNAEALTALAAAVRSPQLMAISVVGNNLNINGYEYPLAAFKIEMLIEHQEEVRLADAKLTDLKRRAADIGAKLS